MLTMTAHGRLGRDVELRRTPGGDAVAELALACNYGRKGDDGRKPTQWVRATLWGKQAEALAPYLTKGKGLVLVLDDVNVREYQSKSGTGHSLEGRVIGLEFTGAGSSEAEAPAARPAPTRPAPARSPAPQRPATGFDDMNDDIPF